MLELRKLHARGRFPAFLVVFGHHVGEDAATNEEFCGQAHEARLGRLDQVVEDAVGDVLVEMAFLAEAPDVELEAFQLDAGLVGDVVEVEGGEIRLPGLGAKTSEFRDFHVNVKIPLRFGIDEGLEGVYNNKVIRSIAKPDAFKCGSGCKGDAQGCG